MRYYVKKKDRKRAERVEEYSKQKPAHHQGTAAMRQDLFGEKVCGGKLQARRLSELP